MGDRSPAQEPVFNSIPQGLSQGQAQVSRFGPSAANLALLTAAFGRATGSSGQMTPAQYFRVALEILRRAPCRLLLLGAGRDTELYVRANSSGRTVVLEHHPEWAESVRHLGCTVVPVAYRTRLEAGLVEPCPLPEGVPDWLLHETWDVILIDAPEGYGPATPGRQQSIYLASRLARPGTTVLLHDWNRPHERQCAARYLKQPDELIGERPALAVFHYPPVSSSSIGEQQPESVPAPPEEAPRSEAGTVSASTRPRVLFCSYHGLFDPSSGDAAEGVGDDGDSQHSQHSHDSRSCPASPCVTARPPRLYAARTRRAIREPDRRWHRRAHSAKPSWSSGNTTGIIPDSLLRCCLLHWEWITVSLDRGLAK